MSPSPPTSVGTLAPCANRYEKHYENFPVASWLLPARIRPAVRAIYWFARSADDLADEADQPKASRLRALDNYRTQLDALCAGARPEHARWSELATLMQRHQLPWQPLYDLLSAFEQDVTTHRYAEFDDLLAYCRRSANPVGRLMLELFERRDGALLVASDAVCTALQLANFLQDAALDWSRGRLYLPREDLDACGASEAMLALAARESRAPQPLRCAFERLHRRAVALMRRGHGLPRALGGRAGMEIAATIAGGERILERLARGGHDPFAARPTLRGSDWLFIGARAIALRFR